jgi:Adenylate and Guanylate cyclase catalytic domain
MPDVKRKLAAILAADVVGYSRAALDIQRQLGGRNAGLVVDNRLELRMGIHIGDVVVQPDGDVLGETVNIAARLEGIARPGGICLSEDAYRQIRNRLPARFQDLGEQQLKNIVHPLRVYAMQIGEQDDRIQAPAGASKPRISRHAVRNVPGTTLELPQRARVRAPGLRVQKRTTRTSYSSPMDVRAGLAGRGAENAKGQRLTGRGSPTHAGTFE